MPTVHEIRSQFLDFFAQRGHTIVPGSPVVPPADETTLMFANAGMNQFKDVFLGTGSRPYQRAADTQVCIRAGGKHNDLDDVGRDTYHHTCFEMLGNWSFGDYFKTEAITWAWELLTGVYGLDPARLHVTVFEGDPVAGIERDQQSADIWANTVGVPAERIHLGHKKDNFWEMGATGPCGPCTEIHYDRTPDASGRSLVNASDPRVIEIWNLVFIQFNRQADGHLEPLPARHVDTGMGFERLCAVLAGRDSNYDTDVFRPLLSALADLTGHRYLGSLTDSRDVALRVVADHVRMAAFAITDGARPDSQGRGSVLRSVIRRAVRWGYSELGRREPFVHRLVEVLACELAAVFPRLAQRAAATAEIIATEEADFLKTVDRGLSLFDDMARRAQAAGGVISGADLFTLHATHGFPADMSAQMARDRGLTADMAAYEAAREEHRRLSHGRDTAAELAVTLEGIDQTPATTFEGYDTIRVGEAQLVGLWNAQGRQIQRGVSYDLVGNPDYTVAVALDRSPFYVEGGGQVGDTGVILSQYGRMEVQKVSRAVSQHGPVIIHHGRVTDGVIQGGAIHGIGQPHNRYTAVVDAPRRRATAANHTATHLLNWALRQVFGPGLDQASSLVDQHKTRFGFTFDRALTEAEIAAVEDAVNAKITADEPVAAVTLPLTEAKAITGLRAVFGERYPDPVRVVMIGTDDPAAVTMAMSAELCGGTHLPRTGGIGLVKIVAQESESKGVRRLTAVTGGGAIDYLRRIEAVVLGLTETLKVRPEDLAGRVEGLLAQVKDLQRQLQREAAADLAGVCDQLIAAAPVVGGVVTVIGEIPKVSDEAARGAIDRLRAKLSGPAVIVLAGRDQASAVVYAAISPPAVARGLSAGKLVSQAAALMGGKGGGRPEGIAQGGGPQVEKLPQALDAVRSAVTAQLA